MAKKEYPGGFRLKLTLATARRLAVQVFRTAKGLGPDACHKLIDEVWDEQ